MADWVKENRGTIIFIIIMFIMFFFALFKPYVDRSDKRVFFTLKNDIDSISINMNNSLDSLIKVEIEQTQYLKKLADE
jgi:hypothetical protein